MRHVADIPYPQVKITLFAWNGKYLLKLEQGLLEQTYKVPELEMSGIAPPDVEIRQILDDEFLQAAVARFRLMHDDLRAAHARQDAR